MNKKYILSFLFIFSALMLCAYTFTYTPDQMQTLFDRVNALATTHDTSTELDALYEAELDNSAGLLAALSDETGTGVAVFGTAPTFTTSITIGTNVITEAEAGYLEDVTSSVQDQIDAKEGTLTNEAGLYSALSDVSNFTQPGTTETITAPWTFSYQRATAVTGALGSIATGDIFRTNAASYDPGGLGAGAGIYRVLKTAAGHVPVLDDLGNSYTKSIPAPAYSHIATTADIPYDDTTGDTHTLTYSETHGGWITNAGAGSTDKIYTVPTYDATMNFAVMVVAGAQMDIDPPAGDTLWLCIAGTCTEGGADKNIFNDDDTDGDVIACKGYEETDGVYELKCFTSNTGWELES